MVEPTRNSDFSSLKNVSNFSNLLGSKLELALGTTEFDEPVYSHELSVLNEEPRVQNVVATVELGTVLDLKDITLRARNAEYNPKRFAAVIMRIRQPKTTALIFSSGRMVVTGAKDENQARLAARK